MRLPIPPSVAERDGGVVLGAGCDARGCPDDGGRVSDSRVSWACGGVAGVGSASIIVGQVVPDWGIPPRLDISHAPYAEKAWGR